MRLLRDSTFCKKFVSFLMHFWLVLNFSIKGVCCFSLLKWTLFSMIVTIIFLWSPQVRTTRIFTCMTSTRTSMLRHLLAILVQSLLWYRQPQENCSSQLHTTPQCRYTHIRSTGSKDITSMTTVRTDPKNKLTNGIAANWAPEVPSRPFYALSRSHLTLRCLC